MDVRSLPELHPCDLSATNGGVRCGLPYRTQREMNQDRPCDRVFQPQTVQVLRIPPTHQLEQIRPTGHGADLEPWRRSMATASAPGQRTTVRRKRDRGLAGLIRRLTGHL